MQSPIRIPSKIQEVVKNKKLFLATSLSGKAVYMAHNSLERLTDQALDTLLVPFLLVDSKGFVIGERRYGATQEDKKEILGGF